jgi:hypothetical protein
MIIARVEVGLGNTNIKYNTPGELGTAATRGTVLANGEVVRGIGTHFASQSDKERYDALTKQQLQVRAALAERFVRVHFFKSAFIIKELGEAKKFVEEYIRGNKIDPCVRVDVIEGDFSVEGGITDKQLVDWSTTVKEQLERVRLGQKKGQVNREALTALETLADCPALSQDTAGSIRKLVGEFRLGHILKDEFQRSIQILNVKMDATALTGPKRSVPEA